jgi:HEAT repeat protein
VSFLKKFFKSPPPDVNELKLNSDIRGLIEALAYKGKNEKSIRKEAEHALRGIRDPSLVPDLIACLKGQNLQARRAAVQALSNIANPQALQGLIEALDDEGKSVRLKAVMALGEIGDPAAVEPLIKKLRDSSKDVRAKAATVLGELGDERAVEPLWEAKNSSFGTLSIVPALEKFGVDTLASKPVVGSLHSKKRPRKPKKREAPKLRAKVPGKVEPSPPKDPESRVEYYAKWLKDRDRKKRAKAAMELAKLGALGVEPLIGALNEIDGEIIDVRDDAIRALGEIGDPRAVEPLTSVLLNTSKYAVWERRDAAKALGNIGGEQAVSALTKALKDPRSEVRIAAGDVLEQLGTKPGRTSPGEKPVQVSTELRKEIDNLVSVLLGPSAFPAERRDIKRARERLIEIGEPAVLPLIQILKNRSVENRGEAAVVLREIADPRSTGTFLNALEDSNNDVVLNAAMGLGNIGAEEAMEPLMNLYTSHDKVYVRAEALRAMGKIDSTPTMSLLIEALEGPDESIRNTACQALGETGDAQALEPLISALQDEYYRTRRFAADGLGILGDPRAIGPLEAISEDPKDEVRKAVSTALDKLKEPLPTSSKKGQKMAAAECSICGKEMHEGKGVATISMAGDEDEDPLAATQKVAEELLARKVVCANCQAVFCLECGNKEGRKRESGKTYCPNCGKVVPNTQLT